MDVPRDYDPKSPQKRRQPTGRWVKGHEKSNLPAPINDKLEDEEIFEVICPTECRLIEYGGCEGPCALMARSDKVEPVWPTPTNRP